MIKNIAVHHFGGLGNNRFAKTQHLTVEHINNAHKANWPDLKSSLGYWVGYNVVVNADGSIVQTRKLGEQTAAATGYNFNTFHICLAGNFTKGVEVPTEKQVETLRSILRNALEGTLSFIGIQSLKDTVLDFHLSRIYPHRLISSPGHTECYGSFLDDDWARLLATVKKVPPTNQVCISREELFQSLDALQKIQSILSSLKDALTKKPKGLGGGGRECGLLDINFDKYE